MLAGGRTATRVATDCKGVHSMVEAVATGSEGIFSSHGFQLCIAFDNWQTNNLLFRQLVHLLVPSWHPLPLARHMCILIQELQND